MAKIFKIIFDTNLKDVLSMQNLLKGSFDKSATSVERYNAALSKAKDLVAGQKDMAQGLEQPFENLISEIIPGGSALGKYNNKLNGILDSFVKLDEQGGFMTGMTTYMDRLSQKVDVTGELFRSTFGGGLQGMITKTKAGMSSLYPVIKTIISKLMMIAPIIIAIMGIVFLLKRMWKNNIGGMQTKWMKFMAGIKQAWSRFIVSFDRALRKMAPLFKVLGLVLLPIKVLFWAIATALKVIWAILKPIFAVFAEIGKAISEAFGGAGVDTKKFWEAMGKLANAAVKVGAVIGKIIAYTLKPLVWIIKGIIFLFKLVDAALDRMREGFKNSFGKLKPILDPLIFALKLIWDFLKGIWNVMKAIADAFGKFGEAIDKFMGGEEVSAVTESKKGPVMASQVVNRSKTATVNNNANVVVHSSGPITPENAPQIGDVISSSINTQSKVI